MFWCFVPLKQPGMRPVGAVDTWMWREPGDGGVGLIPWCDARGSVCGKGKRAEAQSCGAPVNHGHCRVGRARTGECSRKDGFSKGWGDSEVKGDQACKSERILRTV